MQRPVRRPRERGERWGDLDRASEAGRREANFPARSLVPSTRGRCRPLRHVSRAAFPVTAGKTDFKRLSATSRVAEPVTLRAGVWKPGASCAGPPGTPGLPSGLRGDRRKTKRSRPLRGLRVCRPGTGRPASGTRACAHAEPVGAAGAGGRAPRVPAPGSRPLSSLQYRHLPSQARQTSRGLQVAMTGPSLQKPPSDLGGRTEERNHTQDVLDRGLHRPRAPQ